VSVGVGSGVGVGGRDGEGVGGRVGVGVGAEVGVGVGAAVGVGLDVGPGVPVAAGGSVTTGAGVPVAVTSGPIGSLVLDPDGVPPVPVLDPGSAVEPPGAADGSAELVASAIAAGLGPRAVGVVRAGARNAAPIMIAAISDGSSAMTRRRIDRGGTMGLSS
jgi:hypothetical protein